jgi:outer membrane protein
MQKFLKIILLVILALYFFSPIAQQAGAESLKIGVVDVKRLQSISKRFQTIKAQLQKKVDELQKKLNEQKEDLLKIESEFQKQSLMLSLDAQVDKQKELKRKRLYLEYLYKDYSEQMKDAEREAAQKLGLELKSIVKKIAEKEGYILIFEKGTPGLIVYDDVIEITDMVIEAYDAGK